MLVNFLCCAGHGVLGDGRAGCGVLVSMGEGWRTLATGRGRGGNRFTCPENCFWLLAGADPGPTFQAAHIAGLRTESSP